MIRIKYPAHKGSLDKIVENIKYNEHTCKEDCKYLYKTTSWVCTLFDNILIGSNRSTFCEKLTSGTFLQKYKEAVYRIYDGIQIFNLALCSVRCRHFYRKEGINSDRHRCDDCHNLGKSSYI